MKIFNLGVDYGNHDTKTAHTSTPSGYNIYPALPPMSDEYVKYNGKYFVITQERFKYESDKTMDERCFIMTLFGIAKELIYRLSNGNSLSTKQLQESVGTIIGVNLGAGLPPSHCMSQSEKLKNYYLRNFGNVVEFEYNKIIFKIKLDNVFIFPQDYSAVHNNPRCKFVEDYNKCFAIDIGGYTVDVVTILRDPKDMTLKPDMTICASKELGVLKMYSKITEQVLAETGTTIDNFVIESVLTGKKTVLSNQIINIIHNYAELWCAKIINEIREMGVEYQAYPCIFLGGGSVLLKKYINKNPLIAACEFLTNTKANAEGYERFLNTLFTSE